MGNAVDRSFLHVEGEDDLYTLAHLLTKHGIDYDTKPWPMEFPKFKAVGNDVQVLRGMETAIKAASNRSVGFVIDANSDIKNRWIEVREQLAAAKVENLPEMIPKGAFIGSSEAYRAKVGVWIMPDNEHDGKLEDFLRLLVADKDPLIGHAEQSTDQASQLGAKFSQNDRVRAVIRTWLAWQDEPGHPYGRAIQRRYFQPESEVANQFVSWFKQLFSISK